MVMRKYYRGQYIRCTEEKMIAAIKLFNLGANSETMRNFLGTSVSRDIQLKDMINNGKVYFLDKDRVKCIDARNERLIPLDVEDGNDILIDEDLYGGPQGKLPEYVVLWDNYQQTIKDYE